MHEAKTRLSQLVERAEAGEDIVIARHGKPVARIVAVAPTSSMSAVRGALKGHVEMAEDFDELPADVREAFGVK